MSDKNLIISNILQDEGPLLGSELNKILQDTLAVTPEYARKLIQRASNSNVIFSTKPVSFQRGQFLYYLEHQDISQEIINALKKQRKGLSRVIQSLIHQKGRMLKTESVKLSAAITNNDFFPNNISDEKVVEELFHLELINKVEEYQRIPYISSKVINANDSQTELFLLYRRHMVNRLFTLDALEWMERCNLVSWNQTLVFDTLQNRVDYNGQLWDAVGFTYLYGHYVTHYDSNEKIKTPSFVFIESIFHRQTYVEDVEGFISRIQMQDARMKNFKSGSRITPVLFYRSLEKEAFHLAKEKGLLLYQLKDWLGDFSLSLFEFLVNPYVENHDQLSTQYCFLLNSLGLQQSHIYRELFVVTHADKFIQKEWAVRRHLHYLIENEPFYVDWLMFDKNDTPHICTFISKHSPNLHIQINEFVENTFSTFESIYHSLKGVGVKWMIFDEEGLYLHSE